ncbi:hypothetical protein OM076_38865 [Solirubrobacter ginsenosidimutans]|uniref:Uncharacterized protein n=1 Tax=Solirubrobacter ginsenosidimutans TaxID=490573 RepID=A0A9X3S645_9ACTN|nr:hypothetical protein [Solirubrobacter ginsenosidimutans]MDA0166292.1 hypothetical protein [Solirubrobacter ginsenosidimutans]
MTEYPACPELWARNVGGSFATPNGIGGGWRFDPPDGTSVAQVDLQGSLQGLYGWEAAAYTIGTSARVLVGCPGLTCPGSSAGFAGGYPAFNSGPVILSVRCGASACSNGALGGQIYVSNASVTLNDYGLPTGRLTGGSLLSGGWKSGTQTVVVDGSDNIGIQSVRALIDGAVVASAARQCTPGQKVPCSNGATEVRVPTNGLSDGPHDVAAQVVDGSGNVITTGSSTFYVDTVAPTAPLDVAAAGGVGWRASNKFTITWRNPPQNAAPIAAARYTLCPDVPSDSTAEARSKLLAQCTTGTRSKRDLTSIDNLELPKTGQWDVKLWLVDEAGNEQPAKAVELDGLGFDDAPPSATGFTPPTPDDPTRVHMQAADSLSGLAGGSVEARRDGQTAWQPLPTDVTAGGLSAVVDDETLPKGLYFLRARVTDAAGLEASNDRTTTGDPATIKLPIRLASRLTTGRRGKRTCHGHGHTRTCRYHLVTKPNVRVGRSTRLYGRLTVSGTAMPGAQIEIWRQLKLTGAPWARVGTVITSRTGRFSYLARRGPARSIRFRYAGTPTVRGRNDDVALRVRASSTLRPSRRNVVNGEYVTFRGRLAGGWIPPTGALVELQVRSRGQWRTFAQPRASAKTGRYTYRYRFETVRGRASFKFRARIRQQPGFPFVTGTSRAVRVQVRGL